MYNDMSPTELCWQTGDYTDECHCEFCEHCGASIAAFGIFSKKINKTFKCSNCGYTW